MLFRDFVSFFPWLLCLRLPTLDELLLVVLVVALVGCGDEAVHCRIALRISLQVIG